MARRRYWIIRYFVPSSEISREFFLPDKEIGKKITWTLDSKHFYGKACDFVPFINGKVDWNAPLEYWQKCGEIAESIGFEWGGRWKNRDLPHIEWNKA